VKSPEVTFLIPCLNEAESLGHVLSEISGSYGTSSGIDFEIVVADNGSTDGSQDIAKTHGARVVNVPRRGYGAALLGGIAASQGTFIVMGDADGSYRFGDAKPIIDKLRGGADLVMGNRFAGGIDKGAMPWLHKYLGNPVLSWLGRLFFRVPVKDFHCGLRGFRKASIDELGLETPGMEFASEMLVMAQKRGLRIEETPVTLGPDLRTRAPHLRTWRDGWRHLRFLLMHSPTWAFIFPATVLALGALVVVLIAVFGQLSLGSIALSYKTGIAASGLALVSLVALWTSYIARLALGEPPRKPLRLGAIVVTSAIVSLLGAATLVVQLIQWGANGFGPEELGSPLLITVFATFALAAGGISVVMGLLTGLVRTTR